MSDSSAIIALPRTYQFSKEEIKKIKEHLIDEYGSFLNYYEEKKETEGEFLTEQQLIQKQLGSAEKGIETKVEKDTLVDDVTIEEDIQKGFKYLTTEGFIYDKDDGEEDNIIFPALAIIEILFDKIFIMSIYHKGYGATINILATKQFKKTNGLLILKNYLNNHLNDPKTFPSDDLPK